MIELNHIQRNALNNLIKNNKALIFWPRQSGKSLLLEYYIEHIVKNYSNEEILFVGYDQQNSKLFKNKLQYNLPNIIERNREKELKLINGNYITFYTNQGRNLEYSITTLKPTLIIFDDFKNFQNKFNNIIPLFFYLKCKLIITSDYIDFELIKKIDYINDYYINIIPNIKEYWIHDINSNCYDFDKLVKENLYYKSDNLLDFDNIIFQREKKIKLLNKISNGS